MRNVVDRDIEARETSKRDQEQSRAGTDRMEMRRAEPPLSREHEVVRFRGHSYYLLSPAERETMREIGRFRTVAVEDLSRYRYSGKSQVMRQDLRSLCASAHERRCAAPLREVRAVHVLASR
jgi:hypothetical protein